VNVLDGKEERLLEIALRLGHAGVDGIKKLKNRFFA
jgi:hypothetical protein